MHGTVAQKYIKSSFQYLNLQTLSSIYHWSLIQKLIRFSFAGCQVISHKESPKMSYSASYWDLLTLTYATQHTITKYSQAHINKGIIIHRPVLYSSQW